MSWFNFYKNRVNSSYLEYAEKRYKPMIDKIIELCPENIPTLIEGGCGIGTISCILSKKLKNSQIFAFDISMEMLSLAETNIMNNDCSNVWTHCLDILEHKSNNFYHKDRKKADVAFSHGVLEHFSDDEIRTIIFNQKQYAKNVVHYVPTSKYKVPSFGDERLLSMDEWIDITNPKQAILFNDNYDLLLVF
jgi:site-specific DNA-adenine methylase